MTVGEMLTEARAQAGLTVEELSERTRIRGTVIRSIEQDDYEACGGDLYVRGYVRAIAGAVGIDAQPLIREFDQVRGNGEADRANGSVGRHAMGLSAVAITEPATVLDQLRVPEQASGSGAEGAGDQAATRLDLPAVPADPAATVFDLPVVADAVVADAVVTDAALAQQLTAPSAPFPGATAEFPGVPLPSAEKSPVVAPSSPQSPVTEDLMAAGYDLPQHAEPAAESYAKVIEAVGVSPAGPQAPFRPPATDKRRRGFLIVAAVIVVIAAGVLVARLTTGKTATTDTAATSPASRPAASSAAAQASASAAAQASQSAAARASASAAAKASHAAAPAFSTLSVASAAAFGPDGTSDGDNSSTAANAIAADPTQPWTTQWYVSPTFGMLKHGTGLLLDLGSEVTVSGARMDLAAGDGNLQLWVGDDAEFQDLTVVKNVSNGSGTVQFTLSRPVTARYLLIWFTKLAPDGSGHYQESVAQVKVTGRR